MKKRSTPISDLLRQAVKDSGVTRYELAKQLGISESVLSRFVAGKKGLTLATVDRLAELLGLKLVQVVSRVARRFDAGKVTRMNSERWIELADRVAVDANENNSASRRGCYRIEDESMSVLALYDNNPYARAPKLRDQQLAELVAWCKAQGIEVLGEGVYGDDEHPEYTRSVLLAADGARTPDVLRTWTAIIERTMTAFGPN